MSFRHRSGWPVPVGTAPPVRFLLTLQAAVLALAIAGMGVIDRGDSTALAWALIVLVAVSPFVRVGLALETYSALFSVAFYVGLQLSRTIQGGDYLLEAFAGFLSFVVVAWLGRAVAERLASLEEAVSRNALVEEQTARERVTRALEGRHTRRLLDEEVRRCRQRHQPLSMLVVGSDNWQATLSKTEAERGTEPLARERELLADLVGGAGKVSIHRGGQLAVVMPETPLSSSRSVAETVCRIMAEEAGATVYIGIAEFPTDAVTSEGLVAEAEAALLFALSASLQIADRTLIS